MIKKISLAVTLVLTGISYYVFVVKEGLSLSEWLLVTYAAYGLLAAVALYAKNSMIQAIMFPLLMIYGAGCLINSGWELENIYAHISGIIFIILGVYILITNLLKLKVIKIVLGLVLGIILFFGVRLVRENKFEEDRLVKLYKLENQLIVNLYK